MSRTNPADLAVAFRSVPRRISDALEGCDDATTWSGHARVATASDEAARLLGVEGGPAAVADAIDARRAADWDTADLERLQVLALQLGALVREAEAWCDESPAD